MAAIEALLFDILFNAMETLRCFKVGYSRIHGVGLFYNMALLDGHMPSFWGKLLDLTDDLLILECHRWVGKLCVQELDFFLSGFEATQERYKKMEQEHEGAVGKEKLVATMGEARERHVQGRGVYVQEGQPFITQFTGCCLPCNGNHNSIFLKDLCHDDMVCATASQSKAKQGGLSLWAVILSRVTCSSFLNENLLLIKLKNQRC